MSQEGAVENPPQPRRRRINPKWAYPETDSLIDDYAELSTLAPGEIKRLCGGGKS